MTREQAACGRRDREGRPRPGHERGACPVRQVTARRDGARPPAFRGEGRLFFCERKGQERSDRPAAASKKIGPTPSDGSAATKAQDENEGGHQADRCPD